MAIMIREEFGSSNSLQVTWNYKQPLSTEESFISDNPISPDSLTTEYEALHVGVTRNYTDYTDAAIDSSLKTWTYPYLRPIIMYHKDEDGKIIGRVQQAFKKTTKTLSGTNALYIVGNVSEKEGKESIKDGRLKTVSVGCIVHEAYCSICNQNIAEYGECEHERGLEYDGKICTWRITNMEAKELSYVIVPSDIYAQQTKFYKADSKRVKTANESFKGVEEIMGNINPIVDEKVQDKQDVTEPVTNNKEVEELKAKIETLVAEKETLNTEITTLKKDNKELEDKIQKADKDLSDTKVLLKKAEDDLDGIKKELTTKESALQKEIELREAAEKQLIQDKENKHLDLVESVCELRTKLNKRVIEKEELEKRSDEFLQESLEDLQAEFEEINKNDKISVKEKLNNPGINEKPEENHEGVVKDKKTVSNINVEEAFQNILASAMATKKFKEF